MSSYLVSAIVLGSKKINDKDKIVFLFSKYRGKFSAIAKGVLSPKSKRSAYLISGNILKILLHKGKSLDLITEVSSQVPSMPAEFSYLILYTTEILNRYVAEGQISAEIFDSYFSMYQHWIKITNMSPTQKRKKEALLHANHFHLKVMKYSGYKPVLSINKHDLQTINGTLAIIGQAERFLETPFTSAKMFQSLPPSFF